jgi:hypothetical protein
MGRTFSIYVDPYVGRDSSGNTLDSSSVTSKNIDLRDAFDWSYSWYTTGSALTSAVTVEISNAKNESNLSNAKEWSRWTVFGSTTPPVASGASTEFPPLGIRWARFLRRLSSTTTSYAVNIRVNKMVNG